MIGKIIIGICPRRHHRFRENTITSEKPEEAMTFGELLQLISEQQRRLSVLEIAFSYLSFSLDEKANQLLIHNLMLEAQNQNRDAVMQKYFAQLAEELARRVTPVTPPLTPRQD